MLYFTCERFEGSSANQHLISEKQEREEDGDRPLAEISESFNGRQFSLSMHDGPGTACALRSMTLDQVKR
jgi:hypothetical protein